jgi:hypothetical protein
MKTQSQQSDKQESRLDTLGRAFYRAAIASFEIFAEPEHRTIDSLVLLDLVFSGVG